MPSHKPLTLVNFAHRYNILLTAAESKRARSHLKQLWGSLQIRNSNQQPTISTQPREEQESGSAERENAAERENEEDEVESYLKSKESRRRSVPQRNEGFEKILDTFLKEPRVEKSKNVLEYWFGKKSSNVVLFELSQIALSVPATQVSVERLFSSLKFVLSPQRSQMSETVLNNVLVVRANKLFNIVYNS